MLAALSGDEEMKDVKKASKPILEKNIYKCPSCNEIVGWIWNGVLMDGIYPEVKYSYCPGCGEKVDWDDSRREN